VAVLRQRGARPAKLAGDEVEAVQDPRRSQSEHAVPDDRRRGPGAVAAQGFRESRRVRMGPDRGAVFEGVGHDALLRIALLLGDRQAARDGERGPAEADVASPELPRFDLGPVGGQSCRRNEVGAVGAQELRRVDRSGNDFSPRAGVQFEVVVDLPRTRFPDPAELREDVSFESIHAHQRDQDAQASRAPDEAEKAEPPAQAGGQEDPGRDPSSGTSNRPRWGRGARRRSPRRWSRRPPGMSSNGSGERSP